MRVSLPVEKVKRHFQENGPDASLDFLKYKYAFTVAMAKVSD